MNTQTILALVIAALIVVGCNRQPRVIVDTSPPTPMPVARTQTFETHALRKEIDTFEGMPSLAQSAKVQKAFAEIDGEIAELVEHVDRKTGDERAEAARKLNDLRVYRDAEHVRFVRLQAKAQLQERRDAVKMLGTPEPRIEGSAEKLGEKIDDAARKVESGLKEAADAIREKNR